ncbi:MAG: NAD(P)-dependent oxidoreductase [Gemmatimonadaceae bacterium]
MSSASLPTIGFIGLGKMGRPMCENLLRAGYSLVVHNRTQAKTAPLEALGATVAASPADVADRVAVITTCLDTVASSEQVFLGPAGLVARARSGALLIDHSTISPSLARAIGQSAHRRGLQFLDAPVSGGPEGAQQGTLAIMVGGEEEAFTRATPILRAYGQTILRMGDVGSGTHAKLVNQLLTFVHGATAAEGIALAQRVGLDLDALAEVLRSSFGHSRMLDRTLDRVRSVNYVAGAALSLFEKDLGLVRDVGESVSLTLPVATAAQSILEAAHAAGLSASDIAALHLRYAG